MQQLLENRSPFERLASEGGRRGPHARRLRYVLLAIGLFAFFALLLPTAFLSRAPQTSIIVDSQVVRRNSGNSDIRRDEDAAGTRGPPESLASVRAQSKATPIAVNLLEPWGYNRDRNVPRGRAILSSIASDVEAGRFEATGGSFSLVDYGSDQGYFSISISKIFPASQVMGIEMGGVGGEIWKKSNSQDVLVIQEGKIREHGVEKNMRICQTKVLPTSFFALKDQRLVSDYQLVLSVFHWFDLPTRAEFDRTISTLFLNARTTFIELPIIGDNSALIRKQVGWKNFVKWYDGRTDMTQIITEAAKSEGLTVRVTLVASVEWIKWQRETYRVDVLGAPPEGVPPAINFGCEARRTIYGCARREHFSACGLP